MNTWDTFGDATNGQQRLDAYQSHYNRLCSARCKFITSPGLGKFIG